MNLDPNTAMTQDASAAVSAAAAPTPASLDPRTAAIRALNDALRRTGQGGRLMLTSGVIGLGRDRIAAILREVARFDAFTPDNDPHGEHDCAVMQVAGEGGGEHGSEGVVWKVDSYDASLACASPDPADPSVTVRVLTIMLSAEY